MFELSTFSLHLLAMTLMLMDHLWATLLPGQEWLTCLGRLAFPIFAFLIVEGYFHTRNLKGYLKRLFLFALLSEIPFNLLSGSSWIYPFHQNVLWTFLIALVSIAIIDKQLTKGLTIKNLLLTALIIFADLLSGTLLMVDYFGPGVLTVLVFYFFHKRNIFNFLAQLLCLYVINVEMLGGYYYPLTLFGREFALVQQGFALLALIPIWLYKGQRGYHSKAFQYFCYLFYPLHMLLIYLIWQLT